MVATNEFVNAMHAINAAGEQRPTIANCHRTFMFFADPLSYAMRGAGELNGPGANLPEQQRF